MAQETPDWLPKLGQLPPLMRSLQETLRQRSQDLREEAAKQKETLIAKIGAMEPEEKKRFLNKWAKDFTLFDTEGNVSHKVKSFKKTPDMEAWALSKLPTPADFPSIEWRRVQGRPHILLDDCLKAGYSRPYNLKRAIASQTEESGFVGQLAVKPLIENLDFEYVGRGRGKEEIYVSLRLFARVILGSPAKFSSPDGLRVEEKVSQALDRQTLEYEEYCSWCYYEHLERIRNNIFNIAGYCPAPNPFWTVEREIRSGKELVPQRTKGEQIEWELNHRQADLSLGYLGTPDAIAANKRAIAANKMTRMRSRVMKQTGTFISQNKFAELWQEVKVYSEAKAKTTKQGQENNA